MPDSNDFVPTDVNRKPVTGELPPTEPADYLPDWRLAQIRTTAVGYVLNNGPAIAVRSVDALALVDELLALRERERALAKESRPIWRRVWEWIAGRQS